LDPVHSVRREAVIALGHLRSLTALPAILARLKDEDPEVRRLAVGAAIFFTQHTNLSHYAAVLSDPDWQVRREAVIALSRLSQEEVGLSLLKALGDSHWQVVKEAALGLGRHKIRASQQLFPLLDRKEPDIRKNAAWALGETGVGGEALKLKSLLEDEDADVRKTAERAIESIEKRSRIG